MVAADLYTEFCPTWSCKYFTIKDMHINEEILSTEMLDKKALKKQV